MLYGGPGSDEMDDGGGDDVLYGGAGNDMLWGVKGEDVLRGTPTANRSSRWSAPPTATSGTSRSPCIL
jgi:Ca2+-binding RTX toxin-like protein